MKSNSFHNRARRWLNSVIRQREFLNRSGKTRTNQLLRMENLTRLKRLIEANGYHADQQMASFFIRHQVEIESLLPGFGSNSHQAMLEQYNQFKNECIDVIRKNSGFKALIKAHKNART